MIANLDRYIMAAHRAGCPPDQIRRFIECGIILQPKQLIASAIARECDQPNGPVKVGYGGARGGGKSHWLLAQLTDDCLRFAGLKCLLLRKIGKSGAEALEDLCRSVLKGVQFTGPGIAGVLTFPNGSRIILGHFKDESDIDKYLGLEYDVIGIEESTTLTDTKHRNIATCCRSSKPGWRPRIYETTNPGGVSHVRFKNTFIKPFKAKKEVRTRFVPATARDNAFLNAEYHDILNELVGWQLRAWRDGDWDIAGGLFFSNWRERIDDKPHHVIPWFQIPDDWDVWLALDYGFTHKTSIGLFTETGEGEIILLDISSERKQLVPYHATRIGDLLARNGVEKKRLRCKVAGRDIFQQGKDKDGDTIADQYLAEGWEFTAAADDRIHGAAAVLRGLGDVEAKIAPRLFVTDRVPQIPDCMAYLEHDPTQPEKVRKVDLDPDTGEGGDDDYDMFRYGVMAASEGSWVHSKKMMEWLMNRVRTAA